MAKEKAPDAGMTQYTALITSLVAPLLETPEALEIATLQRETSYTFTIKTHPAEMGRVIGTRGSSIQAIRTVLDAASATNGHRVVVLTADD